MRLIKKAVVGMAIGLAIVSGGCTTYYSVTDPKTGKQYYTTEWETARGGTTRFTDAKTGAIVTIQESEVREVPEKEFEANTARK